MRRPRPSMTARIRAHISAMDGPFSASIAARDLAIQSQRFYHVIWAMRRRGEVQRIGAGWYQYISPPKPRQSEFVFQMRKAMHVKIRFSVREIAILADTYPALAQYAVARLRAAGEIEAIGKRRGPQGRKEYVYRVKNRDEFFLKYIRASRPTKGGHLI
jgi:hypothetical protein